MGSYRDVRVLDIKFLGESHVIANYLIPSEDGPILIETGPHTAFEHLKEAIVKEGYNWKEIRHVLLTHIHFDHAGAAWKFAENGARIYVHPIGLAHLHQPEKLWNSAKRIYKEDMDRLWGEIAPIDKNLLVPLTDKQEIILGGITFITHYTPGHAIHHNAYQMEKVIFTGDVAGVKINGGPVVPPCPPPDIDLMAWKKSIGLLKSLKPDMLYLAHFGAVDHPAQHLEDLERRLDNWTAWVKPHFEAGEDPEKVVPEFVKYTQDQLREEGVSEQNVQRYEKGNPSFMSVIGLMRYWKLKSQGRLE